MAKDIKVFIKEPGKALYERVIPNTIKALTDIVGGPLKEIKTEQDWKVFANKDALAAADRDVFNLYLFGTYYYGSIVFVGDSKTCRTDMPYNMADFLRLTNHLSNGNK